MLGALLFFGCGREEPPGEKTAPASPVSPPQEPAGPPLPAGTPSPTVTIGQSATAAAPGGNRPPKVIAVQFKSPFIHRGVDIEVVPEGFDPDGDLVAYRYHWFINGEKLADLDGPVLAGDRFRKGDRVALRVVPFDGREEGTAFTGQVLTIPNAPPRFVSSPPLQFKGQVYAYDLKAEDSDGDLLTYSLEAAPSGMTIDSRSGGVTWEIGKDQAGEHPIRIVAQDEEGMRALQEYTLTIAISE